MNQEDADVRIDVWLRQELDAVPEPTRAVSQAIDAAAVTPQHRGRLEWLRHLLGLEAATVQRGSADHPEVVLTPTTGGTVGPAAAVFDRGRAISTPVVVVALSVALVVVGATAWLTLGPGRDLVGGSDGGQPMRPIEAGPTRSIAVDPADGHFATLAEAVAEAKPGDRIELYPGIHQAEVVIDKDIEIVGVGDRDEVIVEPLPLARGETLGDRLRVVFHLRDSDATLRGFTLVGAEHGTAVVVDGGTPTVDGVRIDPDGDMATSGPSQPREAMEIRNGASPIVRDSELSSLVSVDSSAAPLFERVVFRPGCILVQGEGTSPALRDVDFIESDCPGFSVSIAGGAHADIEAGSITSRADNNGIRVVNDGSSADISGTSITGGSVGLSVGPGAEVTFLRSNMRDAQIGAKVQDGELTMGAAALVDNVIGLQASGEAFLEVSDTDICNQTNFDLSDGITVPVEPNRVCDDSAGEMARVSGS